MSNAPSLGGSQKDRPRNLEGGDYGAGPGRSGFQIIPKPPALLEGFFLTGPDLFRNYTELYDPLAPWGMWSRPVQDGTVAEVRHGAPDKDQPKVRQATVAAFHLNRILAHAGDTNPRQINRVVMLPLKKSMIGPIHDQMTMLQGTDQGYLPNNVVRLFKQGEGLKTEYKVIWMPQGNPDAARIPNILLDLKLDDGNPRNLQGEDLVEAWIWQELLQEFYNLDPANPDNIKAAEARKQQFSKGGQPQAQEQQYSQPAQQRPMIQTADIPSGPRIYTEAELNVLPPAELRKVALQYAVIDKSMKPTPFKEAKPEIVAAILQAQSQQVAA